MQVIIGTFYLSLGKCSQQWGKIFRPEKDSNYYIIRLLCSYAIHIAMAPLRFSVVGTCCSHLKDKNTKTHIYFAIT